LPGGLQLSGTSSAVPTISKAIQGEMQEILERFARPGRVALLRSHVSWARPLHRRTAGFPQARRLFRREPELPLQGPLRAGTAIESRLRYKTRGGNLLVSPHDRVLCLCRKKTGPSFRPDASAPSGSAQTGEAVVRLRVICTAARSACSTSAVEPPQWPLVGNSSSATNEMKE